jgi:RimJ/RimL family protein N-acetyltransferase/microcystin-dependent protein
MLLAGLNSFTASTSILSASMNANFSTVIAWANGNIQNDNFGAFDGALNWSISANNLAISIGSASTAGVYVASLTGVLASTKSAFDLQSSAAQTTGRALAYLSLSNGSSTIPAMLINNVGIGIGLSITQSGAGSGLKVAQSANAIGVEVTNSGTSSGLKVTQSGNGVAIEAVNSGTASGVKITDSGTGTAALEVISTTKGFLPPRMTYAQRNSISSPVEGLEIYNTDSKCKQVYTGSSWANIGTPVGGVIASAESSAPAGYLATDGTAVSRTTYAELFAKISITHGQGNGTTTFNVPDYRGRFLRGVDGGAANDPDRASRTAMATGGNTGDTVGSVQGITTTGRPVQISLQPDGTANAAFISASATGHATNFHLLRGATEISVSQLAYAGQVMPPGFISFLDAPAALATTPPAPPKPALHNVNIGLGNKIHEWAATPDLAEYFRRYAPPFAMKFDYQDPFHWAVYVGGRPVGLACLADFDSANKKVSMGIMLEKGFRDESIITGTCLCLGQYVFDYLGYNKLCCLTLPHRTALHARLEAAGFTKEAALSENCFWRGQYHDEVLHSMNKKAFDSRYKAAQ